MTWKVSSEGLFDPQGGFFKLEYAGLKIPRTSLPAPVVVFSLLQSSVSVSPWSFWTSLRPGTVKLMDVPLLTVLDSLTSKFDDYLILTESLEGRIKLPAGNTGVTNNTLLLFREDFPVNLISM